MIKKRSLILLILVFALLLTGCDEVYEPTDKIGVLGTEREQDKVSRGVLDELELVYYEDMDQNPITTQNSYNHELLKLVYSPLVMLNSNFEPVCVLAESFAVEGSSVRVQLKEGLTFSDGSPVTAADVVASYNAAKAASTSPYYSQLEKFTSFKAEGELTFIANLALADIDAASSLDLPIMQAGKNLVGCGPYVFSQYNGETVLVKNENYFKSANVGRIKLRSAESLQQIQNLFLVGQLDMLIMDKSIDSTLISSRDYDIVNYNSSTMVFLGVNSQRPALSEGSVRRAISDCIDRSYLRDQTMVGWADATVYPFSPNWYRCSGIEPLPQADTAAAKEQLKGVGELSLLVTDSSNNLKDVASRIAEFLANMGVKINVTVLDSESYHKQIAAGEYDLYLGQTKLKRDMDSTFLFSTDRTINLQSANSAQLDQAYENYKAGNITLLEYCNIWREYTPVIPLFFQKNALFVTKGVTGITANNSFAVYGDITSITLS